MNIIYKIILLILVSILLASRTAAQSDSYTTGVLANTNFNFSLAQGWTSNVQLETRQLALRGRFDTPARAAYFHERLLGAIVVSKKIAERQSLGLGYMLQHLHISTGFVFAHRVSGQYVYSRNLSRFRYAHRFVLEANFRPQQANNYRFRYRFAIELPLSGATVDVHEYYIRAMSELFLVVPRRNIAADGEIRGSCFIGNRISKNQKLEIGLDYRISRLAQAQRQHQFWLNVAYFAAFKMDKAKK
jgi:hypothetical protein